MPTVKLQDIIEAFDTCPSEWQAYLNTKTGECHTITEDDDAVLEGMEEEGDDFDDSDVPEWQKDGIAKGAEVLAHPDDWIMLPTKFDFHEYAVMESFCRQQEDDQLRELLEIAIHGKGAFRRFKDVIHRRGIQDRWYQHRDAAIKAFLVEWLESKGISYA